MPSRKSYGETHRCSTVHTLDNTCIASPRILISIPENYQNADGSMTIPDVLRPYMAG